MVDKALLYVSEAPCVFGGYSAPLDKAFTVVVGVPLDVTTSYRPGTRFAPCSVRLAAANIEFYSLRSRVDVESIPVHDLGDVATTYNVEESLRRVEQVSYEMLKLGKLLVAIGGEHTVTFGLVKAALRTADGLCLLVADAHLDMRSEYMGSKLNHATFMRRLLEELEIPIAYVGVRAVSAEELEYAKQRNVTMFTSYEVEREGPDVISAELVRFVSDAGCQRLYVSVDMDVLDPAYAPGVSNPEAEGLTTIQLLDLLTTVVAQSGAKLVGFDVVEVSPHYDVGGATSIAAAKVIIELIAAAWKSQRV